MTGQTPPPRNSYLVSIKDQPATGLAEAFNIKSFTASVANDIQSLIDAEKSDAKIMRVLGNIGIITMQSDAAFAAKVAQLPRISAVEQDRTVYIQPIYFGPKA